MTNKAYKLYAGGGCFWCLDAAYRLIRGVNEVVCGYAGGHTEDPTYEEVCSGQTGHAEVVEISYDPQAISLDQLLDIFWTIHDPTSLNRQGADIGTQYRSILLYESDADRTAFEASKANAAQYWQNPIVTEITQLTVFFPAEKYHQNYFAQNPQQAYCQAVINPKLVKLTSQYANMLKD